MCFCLCELAKNEKFQEWLRKEMDDKHGGQLTYEGVNEMKYLGQMIDMCTLYCISSYSPKWLLETQKMISAVSETKATTSSTAIS